MHEFVIDGVSLAAPDPYSDAGDDETGDATLIALKTVIEPGHRRFEYLHDLCDVWENDAIVEDVRDGGASSEYCALVEGARRRTLGQADGWTAITLL